MNLNRSTALTLRAGIVVGMVLMVVGLIVEAMGGTDSVLYLGVLVLIASPFIGVLVTFVALITERDWKWVAVAAVLVIITTAGIMIHL